MIDVRRVIVTSPFCTRSEKEKSRKHPNGKGDDKNKISVLVGRNTT